MAKKFTFIILFFTCVLVYSQQDKNDWVSELSRKISDYNEILQPQKLFIHFDKDEYYAGENIWFKIYLIDAITHRPDTTSANLWVELVNSQGEIINYRIFRPENGFAWGDFALSDSIADGNYSIRAYTTWMRNLSPEFHFSKYFYIRNPIYDNFISRADLRVNNRFNENLVSDKKKINIAFFPEGGELVSGLENRVAFKATDGLGGGIDVTGSLINSRGQTVLPEITTTFAGIGYFNLNPLPNETYSFVVKSGNKSRGEFKLPDSSPQGYVLRIDSQNDSIEINLQSNISPGQILHSESLFVLAHTRGIIHFAEKITLNQGIAKMNLSKRMFPSGITHFTVFAPNYLPVAERLVFIDHRDQLIFSTNILTGDEENQNFLSVLFNSIHPKDGPVQGSFSVSVQAGTGTLQRPHDNIVSYLLLSSELVGIKENPGDFFDIHSNISENIDLVMLTHGWRRFAWENVISGNLPVPEFSKSYGLNLSGLIINPANNQPVKNHSVRFRVLSGHDDVFTQRTSEEGIFSFSNLQYNDLVNIEIIAERLPGGVPPFVRIISENQQKPVFTKNIFTKPQQITQRGKNWERPPREIADFVEGANEGQSRSMYGTPDQTIYIGERLAHYRSLVDVLRERVTGITIDRGQVRIRGSSSFLGSNEPIFFIDGVQTDARMFFSLNPNEVHRLEVFKGASTAIFGVRGANGAILAYTKRFENIGRREVYDFLMLGYHSPREFYNDLIPVRKEHPLVNPVQTVFWEPNLLTDINGRARYSIPILPGIESYRVVIQGVGLNGGFGFHEYFIRFEE